jgi:SPX domain protein involved in polyphosphate accumulation
MCMVCCVYINICTNRYGTGGPKLVFVERKTHEDAWTGEVSVKERFIIKEEQVLPLLEGEFDIDTEVCMLSSSYTLTYIYNSVRYCMIDATC